MTLHIVVECPEENFYDRIISGFYQITANLLVMIHEGAAGQPIYRISSTSIVLVEVDPDAIPA